MENCSVCGDEFASENGVKIHKSRVHDVPWKDEDTLREMYVQKEMSTCDIAEEFGVSRSAICDSLDKNGIETRSKSEAKGGCDFSEEQLYHLYHQNEYSTTEIGDMFDLDPSNVLRQMQTYGIKTRGDFYLRGGENPNWTGGPNTVKCEYCGDEKEVYESNNGESDNHFCSKKCYYEWARENINKGERVEITCEYCGDTKKVYPYLGDKQRFCSRECNYKWASEFRRGENHPNWKGEHGDYCGPNWREERRERLEYDGWECVVCGVDNEAHTEDYGEGLHVHHIRPRSEFRDDDGDIDWSEANDIENLISLCASCHQNWEGIPLRPQSTNPKDK